jgi:hypothetical protein
MADPESYYRDADNDRPTAKLFHSTDIVPVHQTLFVISARRLPHRDAPQREDTIVNRSSGDSFDPEKSIIVRETSNRFL